jgi:hypothetical protein
VEDKYVFGYERENKQYVNRVTKQVAILLAIELHNFEHKK